MPHLSIEYSSNLDGVVDVSGLCECLRQAAIATDVFPLKGVRVRALRCEHYAIADGDSAHGFIDISVRLREGRDLATRQRATEAIYQAAEQFLEPHFAQGSLALSLEMRNIDDQLSPKRNGLRLANDEAPA